uniref:NADH-quinone oxidoreductase subunit F n=1 Tax=Candidatus Aschnera chinzeii TaxID=1485666 RepID=A0AAT9G4C1_9ENTR|nr:MAG: NADH-quinone oxidoreductase subunit NuoF [Candidatus Aschnera chinzeii]
MNAKKKIKRTPETHPLTWRIRHDKKPMWINEYLSQNGYFGFKKAIKHINHEELILLIYESGLKGRGGAGYLTGLKWNLIQKNKKNRKCYVLCNADEMEPGSYKDRYLMELLPHLLLEGILISGYALQAHCGYIFLRHEYINAAKYLQKAINEAKNAKLLGNNILNSNFNFEIFIHTGAGRYICGEETALINSLEGNRPIPRFKPPYPVTSGLWGYPTCINNVETLCNLPSIVEHGKNWYFSLNKYNSKDHGTKLMGFSGKVNNPGLWELPFGITAREILEDYAGGMCNGLSLKAWQPGGASTDFLTKSHLDVKMDFENIANAGSRLGTATATAIDNTINMVSVTRNIEEFFARESCGWCTPCRDGLPWIVKILQSIEKNEGVSGDIEILEELCYFLGPGKTFCAHAPGAVEPLQSAIKYFRNEFNSGITKQQYDNYKKIIGIQNNLLKQRW